MPHDPKTRHDLRCFCSRKPKLAVYGIDRRGLLYIHIKVYKQERIFSETVITGEGAKTSIKCRDCFRWYVVTMRQSTVHLKEVSVPEEITDRTAGAVGEDDVVSNPAAPTSRET